jgi:hypothetical protein
VIILVQGDGRNLMREVGSRKRSQPAPPLVIFDDLGDPYRQPARPWLDLRADEMAPTVLDSDRSHYVVWSSLWVKRPDASVRFDLTGERGGTDLRWTLYVEDPLPDVSVVKHMCQRTRRADQREPAIHLRPLNKVEKSCST